MRIAFDLDGTLVTCYERQMMLLRTVIKRNRDGVDVDKVWELKRIGFSTEAALRYLSFSDEDAGLISRRWQDEIESPYWLTFDRVFPAVPSSLEKAISFGCDLMLLTGRKNSVLLYQQIRRLKLYEYFNEIFVVDPRKASSEKARHLENWHADVFIGDTETDYVAAIAAHVDCILVESGQRDRQFLMNLDAAIVTDTSYAVDELLRKE